MSIRRAALLVAATLALAACASGATPTPPPSPSPSPSPAPSLDANGCPAGADGFQQSINALSKSVTLDGQPIALRLTSVKSVSGDQSQTFETPPIDFATSGQGMTASAGATAVVGPSAGMTLDSGEVRLYPQSAFANGSTPALDSVPATPLTAAGDGTLTFTWPTGGGSWVPRFELAWTTSCLTGTGVAMALVNVLR